MRYVGGKYHERKWIAGILAPMRQGRPYLEPFVGLASVMSCMEQGAGRRGRDANKYVVALLVALRDGWTPPPVVCEEEYLRVQVAYRTQSGGYEDHYTGFVGTQCTFAGTWFGSYARHAKGVSGDGSYYAGPGSRSGVVLGVALHGATFEVGDYQSSNPEGCLVYCDPPYERGNDGRTTRVHHRWGFDSVEFWGVVRKWSSMPKTTVVVSSFDAPEDFSEISSKVTGIGLSSKAAGRTSVTERLFAFKGAQE